MTCVRLICVFGLWLEPNDLWSRYLACYFKLTHCTSGLKAKIIGEIWFMVTAWENLSLLAHTDIWHICIFCCLFVLKWLLGHRLTEDFPWVIDFCGKMVIYVQCSGDTADNDVCVAVSYVTETSHWIPSYTHYCHNFIHFLSCHLCIDLRRLHAI